MRNSKRDTFRLGFVAVLTLPLFAGCGGSSGVERYIPAEATARKALETALEAWRSGKPAGAVENTSPVVFVTDTHRPPRQTLKSFEILGEVPGNAPRCFAVKLQFSQTDAEERARYVIVGIDPLWVYRQEDYDLLAHWEHKMPSADDAATSQGGDSTGQSPASGTLSK
jgi:hypothetical protein